jgi:sugar O-acyltransferase (sialic acid O-acetyltransferase NeuD family)
MEATVSSKKVRKIVIAGAGRFGREVAAWLKVYGGYDLLGFVDDISSEEDVISNIGDHRPMAGCEYVVAIGSGSGRLQVGRKLEEKGCRQATIVSPHALLVQDYGSASGAMILGNCSISSNVALGRHVLVQGHACIGHDVTLGDGTTVSSHAFVGGGAVIGIGATLHPHCTVLPDVRIGEYAVVGAGAVVTRDVEAGTTVFGNPAKLLTRHLKPADLAASAAILSTRQDLH